MQPPTKRGIFWGARGRSRGATGNIGGEKRKKIQSYGRLHGAGYRRQAASGQTQNGRFSLCSGLTRKTQGSWGRLGRLGRLGVEDVEDVHVMESSWHHGAVLPRDKRQRDCSALGWLAGKGPVSQVVQCGQCGQRGPAWPAWTACPVHPVRPVAVLALLANDVGGGRGGRGPKALSIYSVAAFGEKGNEITTTQRHNDDTTTAKGRQKRQGNQEGK